MKILLKLIVVFTPFCCLGQNITGTTNDSAGHAIEFVTIIIKHDSIQINSTITGRKGDYHFNNLAFNTYYTLFFSFVGYKSRDTTILVAKDVNINMTLSIQYSQLKEANISSKRKLIERKIDRLVFNVENNVNTIGLDALDILEKTPLVRVENAVISLIGKNEVGVMIDNKLIHLSGDALSSLLKSIGAENIARVEVITNPPAQYEAQGNSGLINIVTKKIKAPGFSGVETGNFSRASYNSYYENFSVNYNLKQFQLFGSIGLSSGSRAPSYQKNTYYDIQTWQQDDKMREYTKFVRGTVGFEVNLSKKTTLGASYNGLSSRPNLSATVSTNIVNKNTGLIDSSLVYKNFFTKKYQSSSSNIHVSHILDTLGKKIDVDLDFFGVRFDNSGNLANFNYFPDGQLTPNSSTQSLSNNDEQSTGYTFNAEFKFPIKKSIIIFGGKASTITNVNDVSLFVKEGNRYIQDTSNTNKFKYKENIQAVFANFTRSLGKWQLQAGLRGEATQTEGFSNGMSGGIQASYFSLFPTIYLTYELNKLNIFSINYGRRIGRPSYSSFNPFKVYQDVYSYSEGNPNLRPSFSNNFELSHTYNNILSTTLSYSKSNNMPSSVTLVQNSSNQQITITGNFLSTTNYQISQSLDLFILKWLESVEEYSFYYTSTYSTLPSTMPTIKGAGGDFRSTNSIILNKAKTSIVGINFTYNFPNVSDIYNYKKYYYVDLTVSKQFFHKNLRLTIEGRDIFKTKTISSYYIVNQIYNSSSANNDSRRFVINASFNFGNKKLKRGSPHSASGEEQSRSGH